MKALRFSERTAAFFSEFKENNSHDAVLMPTWQAGYGNCRLPLFFSLIAYIYDLALRPPSMLCSYTHKTSIARKISCIVEPREYTVLAFVHGVYMPRTNNQIMNHIQMYRQDLIYFRY